MDFFGGTENTKEEIVPVRPTLMPCKAWQRKRSSGAKSGASSSIEFLEDVK